MTTPTIAETLKYANLQMAAEALYGFNAKKTPNQDSGSLTSKKGSKGVRDISFSELSH